MGRKRRTLVLLPELLSTWDYEKNPSEIEPQLLSSLDDAMFPGGFWWICPKGHRYQMSIGSRLTGSNCPLCNKEIIERENKLFSRYPVLLSFLPSSRKGQDGSQSPTKSSKPEALELTCGIHGGLFTIGIRSLVRFLELDRSPCEKCRAISKVAGKSVQEKKPEIAILWDFEKNNSEPKMVSFGTKTRYWWICPAGHDSWEASPDEVARGWRMCPCCPGSHKLVKGCNDLSTTHPEIAVRWDYSRNPITPDAAKIGMNKKFFFICNQNPSHLPEMYLPSLRKNPAACTQCWKEPLSCGLNDFGCLFPDLVPFFLGNSDCENAHEVRPGDERSFLWRCLNGEDHTFERALYNMTSKRSRRTCPICVNRQIIPGLNSLRDIAPEIADEWDYERNRAFPQLSPETIAPRSGHEVFWLCRAGHPSFQSAVWNRTAGDTGCPSCANNGFKKTEPAIFYLIEREESDLFRAARKVGISNLMSSKTRLRHWAYQGFSTVFTIGHQSGELISDLEHLVLEGWIRAELGLGQHLSSDEILGGFTETFAPNSPPNSEVIFKVRQIFDTLVSKGVVEHS